MREKLGWLEKRLTIRLPELFAIRVNSAVDSRQRGGDPKFSQNDWLLEAVREKLDGNPAVEAALKIAPRSDWPRLAEAINSASPEEIRAAVLENRTTSEVVAGLDCANGLTGEVHEANKFGPITWMRASDIAARIPGVQVGVDPGTEERTEFHSSGEPVEEVDEFEQRSYHEFGLKPVAVASVCVRGWGKKSWRERYEFLRDEKERAGA